MADQRREPEWVLLGQAGYTDAAIHAQVKRVQDSAAFDGTGTLRELLAYLVNEALAGRVAHAEAVEKEFGSIGASFARTNTNRVRKQLKIYYERLAKRGEIQLKVLSKSYIVVAPRRTAATTGADAPASACILEPADNSEVYARVTVRGRIDALEPDWRMWLVVLAPDGFYYLQGRVSRHGPIFENGTRIGRMQVGAHEGAEFVIMLVAADMEADFRFQGNMERSDDGFGTRLPGDTQVLASVRVIRRDLRPNSPAIDKLPPRGGA